MKSSAVGRSIISMVRRGQREGAAFPSVTACGVLQLDSKWNRPPCLSFSECACLLPATTVRAVYLIIYSSLVVRMIFFDMLGLV